MRGCQKNQIFESVLCGRWRSAALFLRSRQILTKFQLDPFASKLSSCANHLLAWCAGGLRRILVLRGLVTVGTWHIEDDGGFVAMFFLIDGGEGAEELVGDVGEDGGAASGDFVLGEEEEQAGEEVVDLDGGGEVGKVGGEGGSDFGGVGLPGGERGVGGAEVGVHGGGVKAAAPPVWIEIDASSSIVDEAGFRG